MTTNNILLMRAETFVHAGAGSGNGLIDLPIMREAHNNWPVIFGSAVKGAFRAKACPNGNLSEEQKNWFGNDSESGDGAGALMFGDARLLWLPVRSLNSHTLWVTSPSVLSRFARDMRRMGKTEFKDQNTNNLLSENQAATLRQNTDEKLNELILEDFCLELISENTHQANQWLESLKEQLCKKMKTNDLLSQEMEQKLVMVSDQVFSHLCTMATPVTPHVKLEAQTKANENLWYVETLPPETMLYSTLVYSNRLTNTNQANKGSENKSESNKDLENKLFKDYVQIGGNETTGMGWFEVNLWEAQ